MSIIPLRIACLDCSNPVDDPYVVWETDSLTVAWQHMLETQHTLVVREPDPDYGDEE